MSKGIDFVLCDLLFCTPQRQRQEYVMRCFAYGLDPTSPTGYVLGLLQDPDGARYTGVSEDVDFLEMVEEFAERGEIEGADIDPSKFTRFWEGWPDGF